MPRNLAFVIWMLGWPLINKLGSYLAYLRGVRLSNDVDVLMGAIDIVIWGVIARMLYEKGENQQAPKEKVKD